MTKFIGRQKELNRLESVYRTEGFQMAVVYGRRRVGKSTLISKFLEGKRSVYYVATKVGSERNTALLAKQVVDVLAPQMKNVSFDSLDVLLPFIGGFSSDEKLVLVIDEFPYWAESDESIMSTFQKYIDTVWSSKNIMFIICGSSMSFMEDKVLSEKSPLFGRRTMQMRIEVFNYLESAQFFPNYNNEEKAICYGITGGVAKYLSLIDDRLSLDQNIVDQFFDTTGYLYDETRNLLVQEFSDVANVNNILEQIAFGTTTVKGISEKTHIKEPTVLYCLERLINVGLVERKSCILEENNKRKAQYVLKDQMFRFWYSFIPNALPFIEMGNGSIYYERIVKKQIHTFMGRVFEDMCRTFVLRKSAEDFFDCLITKVDSWWGSEQIEDQGTKRFQSAEIDVVGVSPLEKSIVIGECKFKNEPIDRSVYETLVRRSRSLPSNFMVSKYILFSLGGFSKYLQEYQNSMLLKFTLDDLYK